MGSFPCCYPENYTISEIAKMAYRAFDKNISCRRAIDSAFHNGVSGETYLVGGNNEHTNIEVAIAICGILDSKHANLLSNSDFNSFKELITYVDDRAGHDFRYAIDASKIQSELGWKAIYSFEQSIEKTVESYL